MADTNGKLLIRLVNVHCGRQKFITRPNKNALRNAGLAFRSHENSSQPHPRSPWGRADDLSEKCPQMALFSRLIHGVFELEHSLVWGGIFE